MRWTLLALAAAAAALLAGCSAERSEWADYGVCFVEDQPGATSRHITFTPVRCDDHAQVLGETVGADHGGLRFEDVTGDGRPEAIVESSALRCRSAATPCYDAYRIVMDYDPKRKPPVAVRERTFLRELSAAPDG